MIEIITTAFLIGLAIGLGLHIWACWRLLARMTGVPLLDVLRGGGNGEERATVQRGGGNGEER